MNLSKSPYKGCRDLFPEDKRKLDYIFSHVKKVCESFSYEPYDGPLLEPIALYKAKSGEEIINEQLYSFMDRGGRELAIRPEMTPTLARMISQIHKEKAKPFRWYALPNLMRYERPQKGRLREHWQINCDIFGAPKTLGELEILKLLTSFFLSFGAHEKQFRIFINDRKIVDALFQRVLKLDEKASYKLYKIIDKSTKVSQEALEKMLSEDFKDEEISIIKDYLQAKSVEELKDFGKKYELVEEVHSVKNLFKELENLGIKRFFEYSPAIVRGLDYYTGIVFEAFDMHPENRRAICGGGSYENLLKIFNEPKLPGVGFGLGDVTFLDFLETHGLLPDLSHAPTDILVTFQEDFLSSYGFTVASNLREKLKKNVEFHPVPLKHKKAYQIAEKKDISQIVFLGTDEEKNQSLTLKNLKTQKTETILLSEL